VEGFYETSEDDLFAYMVGIRGDLKILFEGNFRNHKRHGKKCKLYRFLDILYEGSYEMG
jgi:hypothetical protein